MVQPIDHPTPPRAAWLPATLAVAAVLGGSAVVTHRIGGLRERIEQAEFTRARHTQDLRTELAGVQAELAGIKRDLGSAFALIEGTEELARRLQSAEKDLGSIGAAIEAQASSLVELEQVQASFGPGLEKELRERDERLQRRWEALNELAESARQAALATSDRVAAIDRELSTPPDLHAMWRALVGPVVQLAGDASVGSGVLISSEDHPELDGYRTYLLTAWHVVRDIQGDPPELELPVPVQIYAEDGSVRSEQARLLRHDPKLDAALLEIVTPDALHNGARLAPRSRLGQVSIFEPIVAVGCPLGNDPIPTRGEVATCHHEVDGEVYWMINAPTYIGNSGGGIFDSKTHELLGIFSKIYTHGSIRPTIVPHMGLVTPMAKIYDWLEQVGYAALVPASEPGKVAAAAQ
jgi:S1-C subfamily serine protease